MAIHSAQFSTRRIASSTCATTLAPAPDDVAEFQGFLARHQLLRAARQKPPMPAWRWLLNNYLFVRIPLVRPALWLERLVGPDTRVAVLDAMGADERSAT